MKKILVLAAAAFAVSCADNTPKQYMGFIEDASMNTLSVRDLTSEAVQTFTTEGADMTAANGLLVGSPVIVDYRGELGETIAAVKVAADATYAAAVGRWTMADPNDAEAVMGVELQVEGVAASINMATLVYTAWELQGEEGKIILKGQSVGNGQTVDFTETGVIVKNAEGVETLTIEGTGTVLTRE